MNVVITGAGGFIGGLLTQQLQENLQLGGQAVKSVLLADRHVPQHVRGSFATLEGDIGDEQLLKQIAVFRPDVVFHLAAVPGGAAENDYRAGRKVNLDATLGLFETLADMPRAAGTAPPRVVYASTVAVYGTTLPELVEHTTPLHPPLSYGAHKLTCEILLADFSRRGLLDGRSVRLPGIVARPRMPSGLASAFMSDLLHALKAGEPYICPVSPQATAWWMSARRCAENLLHAAVMDISGADPARAWPLPVLRLSLQEVVEAMANLYGANRLSLVHYEPKPEVEAVFGRYPRLDDSASRALGLLDDGSPVAMIRRALGDAAPQ